MVHKKVLFIGLHRPMRSPSQRFRFEQYISYLQTQGFDCKQGYLLNAKDDKIFYQQGNYLGKAWILLKSIGILIKEAFFRKYDIVYVQREAFMLGTTFFERQFARKSKLIYDFDDAIWIPVVSANNQKLSFLKNASKTAELIAMSDLVLVGNDYLADYARQYNPRVKIIPTTLDTDNHKPTTQIPSDRICIGWSGSFSTIPHLEFALPLLHQLKDKYGDKIYFKVIGDANYSYPPLDIQGIGWTLEREITELQEFDIGIMPLPDDQWTRGKCGFKGLSFMAIGLPVVMADVGVNNDIIQNGINGFLANNEQEWIEKLSLLIENKELRTNMGKAGRQTVLDNYSVIANRALYLEAFEEVSKKLGKTTAK